MGTKDCGRWALYGSSEVSGVWATGGPVAGVLVAGGSVMALSTVMAVSWDRFPSCGNCSRALTSMCPWLHRTIVLVVSNKPIQSSMNNTSSDSKVTMRVDGTFHGLYDESIAYKLENIEISEKKKRV